MSARRCPHPIARLPRGWEAQDRSEAEAWLREFAAREALGGALAGVYAPAGSTPREVVRLAGELGVDAILVAAHRLDLGRLLLGTSTHAIARDAPCDVLVLRESGVGRSP